MNPQKERRKAAEQPLLQRAGRKLQGLHVISVVLLAVALIVVVLRGVFSHG